MGVIGRLINRRVGLTEGNKIYGTVGLVGTGVKSLAGCLVLLMDAGVGAMFRRFALDYSPLRVSLEKVILFRSILAWFWHCNRI